MEIIALDYHKRYSFASVQTLDGKSLCEGRIEHQRGSIRTFLSQYSRGSAVAVETIGNWYWIVDEIEKAGTLPTVWIPPGDLRDRRELPRTRMVFAVARTRLKNRIHSGLAKYGLQDHFEGFSDIFGKRARKEVWKLLEQLPAQAHYTTVLWLSH